MHPTLVENAASAPPPPTKNKRGRKRLVAKIQKIQGARNLLPAPLSAQPGRTRIPMLRLTPTLPVTRRTIVLSSGREVWE
jgi:hypothetical protein